MTDRIVNQYCCECCGTEWQDVWDCACDDRCPQCNLAVAPHRSDEQVSGTGSVTRSTGAKVDARACNGNGDKPFSVLLFYPEAVCHEGPETYFAHVWAESPADAVEAAARECLAFNDWGEGGDNYDNLMVADFVSDLVLAGHHKGLHPGTGGRVSVPLDDGEALLDKGERGW